MIYVLSEQALPSSWPYFKRSAPTGIGLQGMTKSPHKVQPLATAFYEAVGCTLNDLDCMRSISDSEVRIFANQASASMNPENIALVLNNAFTPISRSDLFPYTLFDAFKNGLTKPDTPLLWTYSADEAWKMTAQWMKTRAGAGMPLNDLRTQLEQDQVQFQVHNPAPYFDIWLERTFGPDLGAEVIQQFGCTGEDGSDCHESISRFVTATQWACSSRYALKTSYGQGSGNVLYPVEFAEPNCKDSENQKTKACHGSEGNWVRGNGFGQSDFGTWASKAYGAFYRTGVIPEDKPYSLKTWEEMNFDDFNHISSSRWGQFNVRNADCDVLDKLQEEFDWYNFGITNGDEDSMVESSL